MGVYGVICSTCFDIARLRITRVLPCTATKPPRVFMASLAGLKSLNITECGLETMEGLEGLTGLTDLHLSSNQLQSLAGVRGMINLRKLWANDNRIKSVRKKAYE